MNGFLAFTGQLLMPVAQVAYWVFGLRQQASSDQDEADVVAPALNNGADASLVDERDQDFLPINLQSLPPGSFPQLDTDFQSYEGSTDWEAALADPNINAATHLTSSYARKIPQATGDSEADLLVHVVISDNNGLTEPQLRQAATESLTTAQAFFQDAVRTEIDVDLISTTSAQIEWRGILAGHQTALYYPLSLEIEDREGFTQSFDLQVPILSGDFIL